MDPSIYCVIVVGQFKSGKSSLTNRQLLNEGESVYLGRARKVVLSDHFKYSMIKSSLFTPGRSYITGTCGYYQRERLSVDHLFESKC